MPADRGTWWSAPARCLAAAVTRFPGLTAAAMIVLAVVSIAVVLGKQRLDSEILNLLPKDEPAVRGLDLYNSEFTQARELAFLIRAPGDAARVEAFAPQFVTALEDQPWVVRVLDGPQTESPRAAATLEGFALPLLFNLAPEKFAAAMEQLRPDALAERLEGLARRTRAGSPAAEVQLQTDPSGLFAEALRPVFEKLSLDESFAVVSDDGTAQVLTAVTNQPSLDVEACKELMAEVHAFVERERERFGSGAPEVLVTGRAAYVAEVSESMRRDIMITSTLSLAAICALFYCAFGRWFPLLGVVCVLGLSALMTLAAGALIFPSLNVVAIAFCSILFGLGNDFSLLLYEEYLRHANAGWTKRRLVETTLRNKAPGIVCVAATTAAGFLGLLFSGSAGLAQLGALTAVGIAFCAAGMLLFFFLFLPATDLPRHRPVMRGLERGARWLIAAPRWWLPVMTTLLLLLLVAALLPWRPIRFDTRPTSLEPENIPASIALRAIMQTFPATFEPVMLVVPGNNAEHALETALEVETVLTELRESGTIAGFSGVSGLLIQPRRTEQNLASVDPGRLDRLIASVPEIAATAGIGATVAEDLIQTLARIRDAAARGIPPAWETDLPADSTWRFLIDRMLSPDSPGFIIYVQPGEAPSLDLADVFAERGMDGVLVTGWSVMLNTLAPWATRELTVVGGTMAVVILLMLAAIHRDWRHWCVHLIAMAFSFGAIIAVFKLCGFRINLLNVLAFPLILGVGVDYGIHLLMAARRAGDPAGNLAAVTKPIVIAGLTTMAGFGALILASNPSLRGLGVVCVVGIGCCMTVALVFILPLCGGMTRRVPLAHSTFET